MKKGIFLATLLVAGSFFAGSAQATIIYSIDRTISVGSVKGTLTTDGTLGYLVNGECDNDVTCNYSDYRESNITDWSLTLFDGLKQFTINRGNSGFWSYGGFGGPQYDTPFGTNFYATESSLIYDFDVSGFAMFQAGEKGGGGPNWLFQPERHGSASYEGVWAGTNDEYYDRDHPSIVRTGQVVVGWATSYEVPEPGSLAILSMGLAGIIGSRKLKYRK